MKKQSVPRTGNWLWPGFLVTFIVFAAFISKGKVKGTQLMRKFNPYKVEKTVPEVTQEVQSENTLSNGKGIPEIPAAEIADYYREDPVPQSVPPLEMPEPPPAPAENEPVVLADDAPIWVVLLAHSASYDEMKRLQRVFTRRNIEILEKQPDGVYMACIPFTNNMEANQELNDWLRHPKDLERFGISPQVVNLRTMASQVDSDVFPTP